MRNKTFLEIFLGGGVLAVACAFAIFAYIHTETHSVHSAYTLRAYFQTADGLSKDSSVNIGGVKVGTVKGIALNQDFLVEVKLSIHKRYTIPKDSSASIAGSGLFATKSITIQPGNSPDFLKEGEIIERTQDAFNLEKMISHFIFGMDKKKN